MIATPVKQTMAGPFPARRLIGSGAGGQVWIADGPNGPLAVKLATSAPQRARLKREAELLTWLDHPYIVTPVDVHPEGEWLALEYIDGPDVLRWSQEQPLGRVVDLARMMADALAHLHEHELVHGDLKPGNVLVDMQGRPRVIDLGAAHVIGEPAPEGAHGTLGFMAPELLEGAVPSPATDVYALGALLYAMLTGRPPFGERDPAALAWLPLSSLPEPPSSFRKRMPRLLDNLVLRMLARDPELRPSPTSSLRNLLRRSLRSSPGTPVVGTRKEREELRELVVRTVNGASNVVIVHGPEGCGRSTLVREAVWAARREGLRVIEGMDNAREAVEAIRQHGGPCVITASGRGRPAMELGARVLAERLPCLVLITASAPIMTLSGLGARHIQPSPLSEEEVAWVLEAYGLDPLEASQVYTDTGGLPGKVMRVVRSPAAAMPDLTPAQRRLLEATVGGPVRIELLAEQLGVSEHGVVDLAEPLLDRGLLGEHEDGASLMARPR
ncbi:MAG: serine/threonine-protein kinase PknK [Alphaproteobacteria bacterium]|nr:serine/threonine-protein kinase PknK [Alphaproteobacteria bacterium]